ncbi:hypothetical protein LIP_3373 [Limnochorda pilosa]|uniref:Schlafen AlbA-2 domain-containing protein n=1 Tax=Limnochorda pilosa TaxID=1555112 RepID=A0A0K2SPY8_LIMPI|nr:hypothetical protein LIP_3373 [Limnochorda pilosa]
MRRHQVEAWALDIIDSVTSHKVVEDSRVELKAGFIDPARAARRLAAHANAARAEPILWLIGLDEQLGVSSMDPTDLAAWWTQVRSHFAGAVPILADYVISTDDGPVCALLFETGTSPYVVKNPAFGSPGGGPVEREVPWREGTEVRSATREDLIRILVPLLPLPDVELLSATVSVSQEPGRSAGFGDTPKPVQREPHLQWYVHLALYVTPRETSTVVFPVHRWSCPLAAVKCEDLVLTQRASFSQRIPRSFAQAPDRDPGRALGEELRSACARAR